MEQGADRLPIGARRPVRVLSPAAAGLALALFVASLVTGCGPAAPDEHVFEGATMGTRYTVRVVGPSFGAERLEQIRQRIEERLDDVNSKMSTYQADSELSQFNRWQETTPFGLSSETIRVFAEALELSRWSDGAFDVTVGPLVNALGFGPAGEPLALPTDEERAELLRHVGWQKLTLDSAAGTLSKSDPEVYCDLSAVAKGYGVDRVAEGLEDLGVESYMVEVGGEVRTAGTNRHGEAWQIGIERPVSEARQLQKVVPMSGWAMATSGDYRNFYIRDGRRWSHTIDPRTGLPIEHGAASVSVVTPTCLEADGLATTLMVLGPEEGYRRAEDAGLAVLFLLFDGQGGFEEKATTAFEALLAKG